MQCGQYVFYTLQQLPKIEGKCEGTLKGPPCSMNSTAPGSPPPLLKFLDPPMLVALRVSSHGNWERIVHFGRGLRRWWL